MHSKEIGDLRLKKSYQVDLSRLMRLYESNYIKLLRLLPRNNKVGSHCRYDIYGQQFALCIIEKTAYTSLVSINLKNDVPDYLKVELMVRSYHDARVAEVCSCQQESNIKPRYQYPNAKMHQQNEKHQINVFLSDWLSHCLRCGTMITC